ncbi:MAG: AI-2E family transporter [Bacilli bacterium]|nr:AI-2E family transporter [Bacilli bacterium]
MILNKYNIKRIIYIVFISLILGLLLFNIRKFIFILELVFNLINPIIYGFIIAYLLNILVNFFDKKLTIKDNYKKRIISIILSILIVFIIIVLTIILIVPQIIKDIDILSKNMPKFMDYINNLDIFNNKYINKIKNVKIDYNKIFKNINITTKGYIGSSIYKFKNIFIELTNIFLGTILSIIFLLKKEIIIKYINNYLKNKIKKETYKKIIYIGNISNNRFQNFFKGQIIDSFVISLLTFIFMLIFKIPYAFSISSLIFVTNLIPVIGPFIGMIISILLILIVSIKKAIVFIIIRFIANQIDSFIVRPKVLEKSVKIPSILVFIAVIYGGINFGIVGLIISVPIISIIYELIIDKLNN